MVIKCPILKTSSQILLEIKYCTYVSPKVQSTSMLCWAWTTDPQSGLPAHLLLDKEEKGITELTQGGQIHSFLPICSFSWTSSTVTVDGHVGGLSLMSLTFT